MRSRGYAYIRRQREMRGEAASEGKSVQSPAELDGFGLPPAPASELPEDHPLARRYRESGIRITDLQSWKDAIRVGGTELAVA